jgi:lipid-A-disaccharide synthase-like uncharacterized protein
MTEELPGYEAQTRDSARMSQASEIAGVAGTLVVAIAFLPQIIHLAKEHCSAGVSLKAWLLWLLGSVLIFSHALKGEDIVFIALQTVNIIAISVIILLSRRYAKMVCASHRIAGLP